MALKGSKMNASLRIDGNVFSSGSVYQQPVLDIQTDATLDPGASPTNGDRYIITDSGALNANFGTITGVGNGDIVEFDGTNFVIAWDASVQGEGAQVWDKDSSAAYQYNGTAWGQQSATVSTDSTIDGDGSVGSPLGLADDAVTTAKILDANVTDAKLATGIDAAKISGGSVSNTEFDFLDGVTSAIQTQLDAKQDTSEKGAANGYASLDGSGKLPASQLPTSATEYKGAWNASTNTPTLTNGTGTNGDLYRVSAAGSHDFGAGSISFVAGDVVIYNGTIWEKVPGDDLVLSVNGSTGAVTVNAINQLTGDVTTAAASGSESEVATISAGAVDAGKLATDAVTTDKILDGNVTTAKLAADAVDDTKLADDAVGSEHIQAGAVGTSELAADAVDDTKLADDAVGAEHIQTGAVGTAELAADAVDGTKIADDAVDSEHLATDSVGADALDLSGLKMRSGALNDPFTASLTRTFTHGWNTTDVMVEVYDATTGESCFVESIDRTTNAVSITLNQTPTNSLRILLREIDPAQTTITVS